MAEFDIENFPTNETAKEMLHMVSEDFYAEAYVGKWLFQVMGIEWGEIKEKLDELPDQMFIETATWGLKYHEIKWQLPVREYLSYEERRRLIYEKRDYRAPMTPFKMERFLSDVTGMEVHVADVHDSSEYSYVPDHPNRFKVFFIGDETLDKKKAIQMIDKLKQSHTRYKIHDIRHIDFDESDVETINVQNIRFDLSMPFWKYISHDGVILHNGLYCHDKYHGSFVVALKMLIGQENKETIGEASVTTHTKNVYFHNGVHRHDAQIVHRTVYRKEIIA